MRQAYETSIFYEDTDCMGVVYHACYVRFLERCRTELLDSLGPSAVVATLPVHRRIVENSTKNKS